MNKTATTIITCIAASLMTVALVGCTGCGKGAGSFKTETDSIVMNNRTGSFKTVFDAPKDGDAPLAQTVNEWLSETMGGTYDGKYDDMKAIAQLYMDSTYVRDSIDQAAFRQEMKKSGTTDIPEWNYVYDVEVRKLADEKAYVTYLYTCYEFLGGAHGMTTVTGQTFRKIDGRRIDHVLRNTESEAFQTLLKDGLKRYWNLKTDNDLAAHLLNQDAIYQLPLPQCPPLFTADGMRFIYGQYEIAPYAAGTPTFTIPYKDIEPYMMVTARRLQ